MIQYFHDTYNQQYFKKDQKFAMDCCDYKLSVQILKVECINTSNTSGYGQVVKGITEVNFRKLESSKTQITFVGGSGGGGGGGSNLFKSGFDFEQMGIGGLGAEFQTIFRRAFASRLYPASLVKEMGFSHVKGILLYGPPGCGKVKK